MVNCPRGMIMDKETEKDIREILEDHRATVSYRTNEYIEEQRKIYPERKFFDTTSIVRQAEDEAIEDISALLDQKMKERDEEWAEWAWILTTSGNPSRDIRVRLKALSSDKPTSALQEKSTSEPNRGNMHIDSSMPD